LSARNTTSAESPPPAEAFTLSAGPEAAGQRVDRFLAAGIGTLSRSRVKALIETGQVRRDDAPMLDPSEPVRPGATYTVEVPPAVPAAPQAQDIPLTILFEDRYLIVLDKPPGLVVHPAPGNQDGTLVNALLAHAGDDLAGIGGEKRPGIVHRLDKDTSGVMVVAKTERAHQVLSATFASREALERSYLALAWGVPSPASGEISAPIGRHPTDRKRMAVVTRNGKDALTRFSTERAWGTGCALLRCRLATGRTHQIRVHLSHLGHPIVGDPVYLKRVPASARALPAPARDALLAFPRQALHAESLGFPHPITGENLRFNAPLPQDFKDLVTLLDGNAG
jgi:23S rRNA pseudouridine1911/1915/1917 synthase